MKILVVGGYGNFGKRLVASLLEHYDYQLVIAGRSLEKAEHYKFIVERLYKKSVGAIEVDVLTDDLEIILKELNPDIVVNASGPFQMQRNNHSAYRLARACLETGCHYVDLADDREYVVGFSDALNHKAIQKNFIMVCGASTVPGLSSAVIDEFINTFAELTDINYGISPGNKTERGLATVGSILSCAGKRFDTLTDGAMQPVIGWQDIRRYDFGFPLGKRWMGNCEIPDLDLLPRRYPSIKNIRFQAGLEVALLHFGLWLLSGLSRFGLVKSLYPYTGVITYLSTWFMRWGSDSGGMYMEMKGECLSGEPKKIIWQLVAEDGSGPNVPAIAAELIISKIANQEIASGGTPCLGLFTLDEFFKIAGRWGIYQTTVEK